MKYLKSKQGYALLFSVIVSAIVLSIAAFILALARKQFILSSAARDSTVAVYAADGGIQCAVQAYYTGNLATGTPTSPRLAALACAVFGAVPSIPPDAQVGFQPISRPDDMPQLIYLNDAPKPGGGSLTPPLPESFNIYQTIKPLQVIFPDKTCARVVVTDGYYLDSTLTPRHDTIIDSSGYNFSASGPCSNSVTANPRAVERTIRLEYKG